MSAMARRAGETGMCTTETGIIPEAYRTASS
jgi:hypothetical protein